MNSEMAYYEGEVPLLGCICTAETSLIHTHEADTHMRLLMLNQRLRLGIG